MRSDNSPSITSDEVWVFVGGGRDSDASFDRAIEAGELLSNGALDGDTVTASEQLVATDGLNSDLAGFGAGASNGQLYTFGGRDSSAGSSAALCNTADCEPDLQPGAFNSLGAAATTRMYPGATQESAFFFLV